MFDTKYGLEQAVIERRKTMKREIIPLKVSNYCDWKAFEEGYMKCYGTGEGDWVDIRRLAKYKVGEVVAVAQSYQTILDTVFGEDQQWKCGYMRDVEESHEKMWEDIKGRTSKMFVKAELMPHRIRITDIKVERLQDISEEDCLKEGLIKKPHPFVREAGWVYCMPNDSMNYVYPTQCFADLIDKVSGKSTWERNPYNFAYTFELVK